LGDKVESTADLDSWLVIHFPKREWKKDGNIYSIDTSKRVTVNEDLLSGCVYEILAADRIYKVKDAVELAALADKRREDVAKGTPYWLHTPSLQEYMDKYARDLHRDASKRVFYLHPTTWCVMEGRDLKVETITKNATYGYTELLMLEASDDSGQSDAPETGNFVAAYAMTEEFGPEFTIFACIVAEAYHWDGIDAAWGSLKANMEGVRWALKNGPKTTVREKARDERLRDQLKYNLLNPMQNLHSPHSGVGQGGPGSF